MVRIMFLKQACDVMWKQRSLSGRRRICDSGHHHLARFVEEASLCHEERASLFQGSIQCAAAKAVATCLLGLRCPHASDGDTPLGWEVDADHRHAGLAA